LIRSDKLSCHNSDLVLASSKDTILHLVDDYGVLPQKIRLLYEGIPDDFADGVTITDPELPTFLHIGGGPRKGTVFFLEALKILQDKYGLKAKGVITRSDSSITKKAGELQINLETHKYVSNQELKQLFASCTALVSPSLSEGFCLPVVEAMFFGKPSIVTNVGSLPELIEDKHNGFVINLGDIEKLSKCMFDIADKNQLRLSISKNAKSSATFFTISLVADKLIDLITEERVPLQ
jgi:glycosyltransferase involved in cell wall biosynthesis